MRTCFTLSLVALLLAYGCKQNSVNPKHLTVETVTRDVSGAPKDSLPDGQGGIDSTLLAEDMIILPEGELIIQPEEKVAPTQPSVTGKRCHIIVASFPTRAQAEKSLAEWRKKGYPQAEIVSKEGKNRISIAWFSQKQTALDNLARYKKELRRNDLWIAIH